MPRLTATSTCRRGLDGAVIVQVAAAGVVMGQRNRPRSRSQTSYPRYGPSSGPSGSRRRVMATSALVSDETTLLAPYNGWDQVSSALALGTRPGHSDRVPSNATRVEHTTRMANHMSDPTPRLNPTRRIVSASIRQTRRSDKNPPNERGWPLASEEIGARSRQCSGRPTPGEWTAGGQALRG